MSFLPFMILAILHLHLTALQGVDLIFEDGYTVSTVLDGDKSNIKVNPDSILPQSDLFILLDSAASTFYSLSLSTTSNETVLKRLAGNGEPGYADGDLDSAKFSKPTSFAVDYNGNVYVADPRNHAIRKITQSGVTTIAGGVSQKDGRTDGPARDASFSNNFELTFVPQRCALMIPDHGNRLLRQLNLKAADCRMHSGSVLGTTPAWLLGIGFVLSSLLSLVVGFVIRPHVMPYTGWRRTPSTQVDTLANESGEANNDALLRQHNRNEVVNSMVEPLSSHTIRETPVVSLLDSDQVGTSSSSVLTLPAGPQVSTDQLKDLLTFDGESTVSVNSTETVEKEDEMPSNDPKNIDGMMQDNLVNFVKQD